MKKIFNVQIFQWKTETHEFKSFSVLWHVPVSHQSLNMMVPGRPTEETQQVLLNVAVCVEYKNTQEVANSTGILNISHLILEHKTSEADGLHVFWNLNNL